MKFGAEQQPLPKEYEWRFMRQFIAAETGWTLETVDGLNAMDVADWMAVREARAKATPRPKKQPTPRPRRR